MVPQTGQDHAGAFLAVDAGAERSRVAVVPQFVQPGGISPIPCVSGSAMGSAYARVVLAGFEPASPA